MMETSKKSPLNLIAGGLFVLLALNNLFTLVNYFSVPSLLWIAGYVLAAVMLFIGGKNILPAAGFSLLTLMELYALVKSTDKLTTLLDLLVLVSLILVLIGALTDYLPGLTKTARQLWFIPGVLAAVNGVIFLVGLARASFLGYAPFGQLFLLLIRELVFVLAMFLTGAWAANPDGRPARQVAYSQSAGQQGSDGYIGMAQHVLLLLFTLGIWNLIWIYRTTAHLNRVEGEPPRTPVNKLLLCMFVPFYGIYWTYQSARRVDKLAAQSGVSSDLTTLCLVLAIFVPIIPPILIQEKINTVASAGGAGPQQAAQPQQGFRNGGIGTAEELKTYKDLLDSGAITQEEFEAKKRQILGL